MAPAYLKMGVPTHRPRKIQPYGCAHKKIFGSRFEAEAFAGKRKLKQYAYGCRCGFWHLSRIKQ
jgi:hypothetical protein